MTKSVLFRRIRLTTFLLVITTIGVSAQVLAMTKNLSHQQNQTFLNTKINLSQLLDNLEDSYKVRFNYKASLLKNVQVETTAIQSFKGQIDYKLNEILADVNLKCEVINPNSFVIIPREKDKKDILELKPKAAEILPNVKVLIEESITGKVVDENGEGIPGVSIVIKGTTKGTTTNARGEYSINVPDEKAIITFSSIGYDSQNISIGNRKIVNVSLTSNSKGLSEVIVIGYGTRKKDELSGAVTQVKADIITKQPVISFDQALAGQVPGMTLREGTGAPGAGPEILIRGINTFGNNKPLIVIDDVIFENYNDQNNNPLALLNSEDIENISILKDAATKAIYGSRATAGVIIVTTKRGKAGKPTFNFSTSFGLTSAMDFEKPNVMNATELAQFRKETAIDRIRFTNPLYKDISTTVPDNLLPASVLDPSQYGIGTNWYDEITRTAGVQNYSMSISGGNDSFKYFISGSYLNQEGIVKFTDLQRISLRANFDLKLSNKFKMGFNLSPSRTLQNRPANDPAAGTFSAYSTLTSTYWASPEAKIYDANGNFNYLTTSPLTSSWTTNPLYKLQAETEDRLANQLTLGSFLEYEPLPNLTFKTSISYSNNIRRSEAFSPSTVAADELNPKLPRVTGATATLYNENISNLVFDNIARYRLVKNKHNIEIMVGTSAQDVILESSTINAKRLLDENLKKVASANVEKTAVDNFTGSEGFNQNRIFSLFARTNYIFDNKYILNLSIRRDGSSRFGRNVQGGNFPAGSVAWRVTEEGFLKNIKGKVLDELRFEVGYGITGNQQITAGNVNYGFLGTITQANYIFNGISTLGNTLNTLPNEDITWEQSKQFDFGFNASLFQKRINVAFNIYNQETSGLFNQIPVPQITGFGNIVGNGGKIENSGFELQVDGLIVKKKNFTWNTSVNISKYNNKILELVNGTFYSGTAGNGSNIAISQVGQPIGMYYGLKILGLFSAEDLSNTAIPKYAGATVGSIKYLDGNGNGLLEQQADHVVIGNPHPDLMFGWTNQFTAYGFNLRAIFAGQLGGTIFDLRKEIMYNVDGNFNVSRDLLNRFRPGDDPSVYKFPTTVTATPQGRWPNDTRLTDGSYVALKNLTLGYNLGKILKNKSFKAAELYMSMRNVFYIANYKEGNPEIRRSNDGSALRSVNYGSYPIGRTTTFGLNVTF